MNLPNEIIEHIASFSSNLSLHHELNHKFINYVVHIEDIDHCINYINDTPWENNCFNTIMNIHIPNITENFITDEYDKLRNLIHVLYKHIPKMIITIDY